MHIHKKIFTLIEMIVVIAIIIILTVSAFMMFVQWVSKTRDVQRMSDLTTMQKSLESTIIRDAKYPLPDNYISINASGVLIGYQGYFGSGVSKTVGMGKDLKDPGDDLLYYTYSINKDQKKYSVMVMIENTGLTITHNSTYAINYSNRYPNLAGDSIGILLDSNNMPIQEKKTGTFTSLDVINTTGSYKAYMTTTAKITGTGSKLIALKNTYNNAKYDNSLVAYYDMETKTKDNQLADLAGNGNNGTIMGTITIGGSGGKIGKSSYFNGNSYFNILDINDFESKIDQFTFSMLIKTANSYGGLFTKFNGNNGQINSHTTQSFLYQLGAPGGGCIGKTYLSVTNNGRTDGSALINNCTIKAVNDNNWHLINIVNDKKTIKFYIDGILDFLVNANVIVYNNTDSIKIGLGWRGSGISSEDYFKGIIDEVRIYNRALTDDEIKALYDASK